MRVVVTSASGNITAIISGHRGNDGAWRVDIVDPCRTVMSWLPAALGLSYEIEQYCFVQSLHGGLAHARISMLGGDFCANAVRSVAWLLSGGRDTEGCIEVANVAEPVHYRVRCAQVSCAIPLGSGPGNIQQIAEGTLVRLPGISHVVIDSTSRMVTKTPRAALLDILRANSYRLADDIAVGVAHYDASRCAARFCVWVRETATMVDERACGSGTGAIGLAVATTRRQSVELTVKQPSGEPITTMIQFDTTANRVRTAEISGTVAVLAVRDFGPPPFT